jgi:alpha-N-acetylglucosamine transferase
MGVEALIFSLIKVNSQFPLIVLYSTQVTESIRQKLERFVTRIPYKVSFQCVPDIGIPELTDRKKIHVDGWINSGYTKLHIFGMEEYDKIVYIDSDAIVLENVDEVC